MLLLVLASNMFTKSPVIYIFVIMLSLKVDAKICERREIVTSGTISYLKRVRFCCIGYMQDNDLSNDSQLVCKAICMPACKNGYCRAPRICACNPGFNLDPKDIQSCIPACKNGCDHGACVAPNECRCEFGYLLQNGTCVPVCTEPCSNGTCTAPETCECSTGYRKLETNLCEPYCSNGCENGFCAAPETCQCNSGWHLTESRIFPTKICEPLCSNPCDNGKCVAPETCNCWPSYKKSINGTCEPECPSGWKSENHKCVAQCRYSCGNGECVSPNVCICFTGYHIDINKLRMGLTDAPLCVPSCTDCVEKGDICVAPDVCIKATNMSKSCEDTYNCTAMANQTASVALSDEATESYDDYIDLINHTSISRNHTFRNTGKSGETEAETFTSNWLQQHWVSVFITLLFMVMAAIVLLLARRWKPIIVYFKGKSYVVKDDHMNGSYSFEDIPISTNKC